MLNEVKFEHPQQLGSHANFSLELSYVYWSLLNLMRNLSTFSLASLFYYTVHRCTKLFEPKVK